MITELLPFWLIIQIWEYRGPDVPSHQRQQSPMKSSSDRTRSAVEEAKGQWLQSEERAKILSEKLSTALADITSKDNLVKQHVKVAEEAVSGTFFLDLRHHAVFDLFS